LDKNPQPTEPWYSQGFLDIANVHCYLVDNLDPVQSWIDQLEFTKSQHPGNMPLFIGEYAEANSESWGFSPRKERYFLEGIWAPFFFADTAGSNLHWRINSLFMPNDAMLDYAHYAAEFIAPFEETLPAMKFHYEGINEKGLRIGYYKNDNEALMYIRDENVNFTDEKPRMIKKESVYIKGMEAGEYSIEFYNPYTGKYLDNVKRKTTDRILHIPLPGFERSLAVKVKYL
jgi:hypothetical protein